MRQDEPQTWARGQTQIEAHCKQFLFLKNEDVIVCSYVKMFLIQETQPMP